MPWVLVGSVLVGMVAGVVSKYIVRRNGVLKIVFAEIFAHLIGSMIVKTAALYVIFGEVVFFRIPISIGILAGETLLICAMYKNKTVKRLIDSGGKL